MDTIVQGAIWRDSAYILIVRSPDEDQYPDVLAWVGGEVEGNQDEDHILEINLRREIQEEIGIEVVDLNYAFSRIFINEEGEPVISVEFLCRYLSGEPRVIDPREVGEVLHLTPEQILDHPKCPAWIKASLPHFETLRQKLEW